MLDYKAALQGNGNPVILQPQTIIKGTCQSNFSKTLPGYKPHFHDIRSDVCHTEYKFKENIKNKHVGLSFEAEKQSMTTKEETVT